jgi:hypothetical protein
MGLSIHYSGRLRHYSSIDELMAETTDICQTLDWTYHVIDGNNTDDLKGICFAPEGCEPVFLTFLPTGRMCSPVNLMNKDLYEKNGLDHELMYITSTNTQYAGQDAHMAIIKLLKHLKEKYFSEFELSDEGMYWETMDEKIFLKQFARYELLVNSSASALSEMKAVPGESATSLADRIEELKQKFGKNES